MGARDPSSAPGVKFRGLAVQVSGGRGSGMASLGYCIYFSTGLGWKKSGSQAYYTCATTASVTWTQQFIC